jgi:hypothetical protein
LDVTKFWQHRYEFGCDALRATSLHQSILPNEVVIAMKYNKLKILAAGAAMFFCFSAPASAVIGIGDSATLFLEVYDPVFGRTYVRDLGLTLTSFGTQNRPSGGFTNIVDDQLGDALVSATDDVFPYFIATSSDAANLIWDVIAIDHVRPQIPDQWRVLFTSLTDVVSVLAEAGVQQTQSSLNTMSRISLHTRFANGRLGFDTSMIIDVNNFYNFFKSNNLAGGLSPALGVTSAGLGQSMGYYYMTSPTAASGGEAVAVAYGTTDGTTRYGWTLATDGALTYDIIYFPLSPAIPEPSTLALYLAGALMLGSVARGRLKP